MSVFFGAPGKRQRADYDDDDMQVTMPPVIRSQSSWECQLNEGTCVPSLTGNYDSRKQCESHPRCKPGAEQRWSVRSTQRKSAIEHLAPLESQLGDQVDLNFVPPGGVRPHNFLAIVMDFAWVFYADGVGPTEVLQCVLSNNGEKAVTTAPGVVSVFGFSSTTGKLESMASGKGTEEKRRLAHLARLARLDNCALPWLGTGVPDAMLTHAALFVAVDFQHSVHPCEATRVHAILQGGVRSIPGVVWVNPLSRGLAMLPVC